MSPRGLGLLAAVIPALLLLALLYGHAIWGLS